MKDLVVGLGPFPNEHVFEDFDLIVCELKFGGDSEPLDVIKPYMRKEGLDIIEEQGVFYMDQDNEPVTSLVNDAECAFVYFDENGITKCAVEKAHLEGKSDFKKPISCHLYPIRVKQFEEFTALNYDVWSICSDACSLGEKLGVPVFQFLKEPLIRAFGKDFFKELEVVSGELEKKSE